MKKIFLTLSTTIALVTSAQASLLINGDFAAPDARGLQGNELRYSALDNSWAVKNSQWGSNTNTPGPFSNQEAQDIGQGDGLAQANTITTETGTQMMLKFDWTAPVGGTGDDLILSYQVVAWDIGAGVQATDELFDAINFRSYRVRGTTGGTAYDLLDGSNTVAGTGTSTFSHGTFTGTANNTISQEISIDLSTINGGVGIENYDIIGIKFNVGDANNPTISGGTLDNVSLAMIPEPSSYSLLAGLLALTSLAMRRREP